MLPCTRVLSHALALYPASSVCARSITLRSPGSGSLAGHCDACLGPLLAILGLPAWGLASNLHLCAFSSILHRLLLRATPSRLPGLSFSISLRATQPRLYGRLTTTATFLWPVHISPCYTHFSSRFRPQTTTAAPVQSAFPPYDRPSTAVSTSDTRTTYYEETRPLKASELSSSCMPT